MTTTLPQPTPTLEQLAARLDALEQQLAVDNITPTYLTTNPDGTVSADFSGVITALGLTIPQGGSSSPETRNSTIWTRPDGGLDPVGNPPAVIGATEDTANQQDYLGIAANAVAPSTQAQVSIGAFNDYRGTFAGLAFIASQGGLPTKIIATLDPQPGAALLLDGNGNSDFLYLPNRKIVTGTLQWAVGSGFSAALTIALPGFVNVYGLFSPTGNVNIVSTGAFFDAGLITTFAPGQGGIEIQGKTAGAGGPASPAQMGFVGLVWGSN